LSGRFFYSFLRIRKIPHIVSYVSFILSFPWRGVSKFDAFPHFFPIYFHFSNFGVVQNLFLCFFFWWTGLWWESWWHSNSTLQIAWPFLKIIFMRRSFAEEEKPFFSFVIIFFVCFWFVWFHDDFWNVCICLYFSMFFWYWHFLGVSVNFGRNFLFFESEISVNRRPLYFVSPFLLRFLYNFCLFLLLTSFC